MANGEVVLCSGSSVTSGPSVEIGGTVIESGVVFSSGSLVTGFGFFVVATGSVGGGLVVAYPVADLMRIVD